MKELTEKILKMVAISTVLLFAAGPVAADQVAKIGLLAPISGASARMAKR